MYKTAENLAKAFIGESMARNRYTFYAKTAKKEGYEKLSEIFLLTAENEREHAKWILRMLNTVLEKDGKIFKTLHVESEVPTVLGTTEENLKSAVEGETYEFKTMYPEFADIAEKEGFPEIAQRLRAIAVAEKHHKERFEKYLNFIQEHTMFKRDGKIFWVCRKCGYVHEGEEPPEVCPSCGHPQAYFEEKC